MSARNDKSERISFEDLCDLLLRIFLRHGVSEENARALALNCASCERDGSLSHGIFRIPGYLASLNAKWVDGNAIPVIEQTAPSFLRVDAANGFAQPALTVAAPQIIQTVIKSGVAVAAIRDSHHFSALWPDLEQFADIGFVALTMVTGLTCVAPPGGHKAIFGTNPLAFATPVEGRNPLIFDFATSSMSNGDLRLAAKAGETVALGTGIDRNANTTVNPSEILDGGALLPFGGHKGGALSLMVEILASAITGGQFSSEVDFSQHPGAETPRTGQLLIVIDPTRDGNQAFPGRVAALLRKVRDAGQTRLPSDRRIQTRIRSYREGIPISPEDLTELRRLAV